ncbi:MAG: Uma2 family endonuclease [Candidatus Eremiobacteraeota bacterium]|nr:Uma2 family endonuclease [Candidatus Eremiobacteraeota bacterium]
MLKSASDMEATVKPHAITVVEFDRMVEAGVYGPRDRIELIDGQLIDVPPQGPPHFGTLTRFEHRFREAFGTFAQVRGQGPLPVAIDSQPEPDISLVRWNDRFYRDAHPTVEQTYAVVEIAYTSLQFDRGVKRRVYGAGRVPEYWIVDLEAGAIEVYRGPHALGFSSPSVFRRGDKLSFEAFPDIVFSVDDLLG